MHTAAILKIQNATVELKLTFLRHVGDLDV